MDMKSFIVGKCILLKIKIKMLKDLEWPHYHVKIWVIPNQRLTNALALSKSPKHNPKLASVLTLTLAPACTIILNMWFFFLFRLMKSKLNSITSTKEIQGHVLEIIYYENCTSVKKMKKTNQNTEGNIVLHPKREKKLGHSKSNRCTSPFPHS